MRASCSIAVLTAAILSGAGGAVVGVAGAHAQSNEFFAERETPATPMPSASTRSASLEGRPSDSLRIDKLLQRKPAPPPAALASLSSEDWAPEHALKEKAPPSPLEDKFKPATASKDVKAAKDARAGKDAKGGKDVKGESFDLDPDEAVKVPAPAPSHDPLDAQKPAAATPSAAAPVTATGATKAVGDALPPLDAAIKAALDKRAAADIKGPHAGERRKERDAIAFFYAAHGFAPLWSENAKPIAAVEPILSRLARASDDALTLPVPPVVLKVTGSQDEIAESEIALTEAVVSYARQATGSRVEPASISPLIGARPELADPAEVLDHLATSGAEAGDQLQALNPSDPRYGALREKLMQLHAAHPQTSDLPIPDGPTLRVGMKDPRVPLVRSRFSLDSAAEDPADLEYDTQVAEAVADFQRANGLPASGNLTRRTIAALSGGEPSHLDGALIANMEMWRWMPRDLGSNRIEVNIPDFIVTVFHDGEPVAKNRVVVGKTETPTPMFSNVMKYLIVNPVWNVPQSIIKKEWKGNAPHGFDVTYKDGVMTAKQPPGAKNALGRIKFIFPNDYSVYLHDTPSKSLFATSKRAYSHGCVRVDQPFALAGAVLNDSVPEGGDVIWSQKRLNSLLGDKERYVYLPQPLPIHIEYFTATVDPDSGRLQLRDDVYDYTRKVAAALGRDG